MALASEEALAVRKVVALPPEALLLGRVEGTVEEVSRAVAVPPPPSPPPEGLDNALAERALGEGVCVGGGLKVAPLPSLGVPVD